MSKPITEPSTGRAVATNRWGIDQLYRRPLKPGNGDCMVGYDTTLTTVSNTTTPTTFLSFVVPANDVLLGNIVYVQWTMQTKNQSAGPVQPTLTLVWGSSANVATLDATDSAVAAWSNGAPFVGDVTWAIMLQRRGDDGDETDPDGSAFVVNPSGGHPVEQPARDPSLNNPPPGTYVWNNVNFTIDQLVEFQISWDTADPLVSLQPHTASATRWC